MYMYIISYHLVSCTSHHISYITWYCPDPDFSFDLIDNQNNSEKLLVLLISVICDEHRGCPPPFFFFSDDMNTGSRELDLSRALFC